MLAYNYGLLNHYATSGIVIQHDSWRLTASIPMPSTKVLAVATFVSTITCLLLLPLASRARITGEKEKKRRGGTTTSAAAAAPEGGGPEYSKRSGNYRADRTTFWMLDRARET